MSARLGARAHELSAEAERHEAAATATPVQQQPLAEETAEPGAVTIDMIMVGDILMHDEVVAAGLQDDGTRSYDFLFDHVRSYVADADVSILNQETVMGLPGKGFDMTFNDEGSPIFNTPIELIDAEMRAGFNTVIKATNHVFDQGYEGLAHELDYWHEHYPDVPVLGVDNPNDLGGDQDRVHNVYIYEKDGFKVAILNYTFNANNFVDYVNEFSTAAFLNETRIRSDVAKARSAGADMIVACPHWGAEYQTEPSAEENNYAQVFSELGVDVVFGTHPHILQPVEVLENASGDRTVCFFSNGSLVAADGFKATSLIGGISRVTLVKDVDGTCRVESASLVPTVVRHADAPNLTVWPLSEYTDQMAAASNRPELTVKFADEFCADLFGDGYDLATHVYTVELGDL